MEFSIVSKISSFPRYSGISTQILWPYFVANLPDMIKKILNLIKTAKNYILEKEKNGQKIKSLAHS
jgi:hypothetical protein